MLGIPITISVGGVSGARRVRRRPGETRIARMANRICIPHEAVGEFIRTGKHEQVLNARRMVLTFPDGLAILALPLRDTAGRSARRNVVPSVRTSPGW
jgi:hypothetical protein